MAKRRKNKAPRKGRGRKAGAAVGIILALAVVAGVVLYLTVPAVKDCINGIFTK